MGAITGFCQRLTAGKRIGTSQNGIEVYRKITNHCVTTTSFKNGKKFKTIFQSINKNKELYDNSLIDKSLQCMVTNHETGEQTLIEKFTDFNRKPTRSSNWAIRDYAAGFFKHWNFVQKDNDGKTKSIKKIVQWADFCAVRVLGYNEKNVNGLRRVNFKEIIKDKNSIAKEETRYLGQYEYSQGNNSPRFVCDEGFPIRTTMHKDGSIAVSQPSLAKKSPQDSKLDLVSFE